MSDQPAPQSQETANTQEQNNRLNTQLETPPKEKLIPLLMALMITSLAAVGFLAYQNFQLQNQLSELIDIVTENSVADISRKKEQPKPTQMQEESTASAEMNGSSVETGQTNPTSPSPQAAEDEWLVYNNSEYGFEISYPQDYKALDDATNLYGWPNAVVLIHGGGQAYDVVVEAWDSQEDYLEKYPQGEAEVTIEMVGDKYLTLNDYTKEEMNTEIINSFSEVE